MPSVHPGTVAIVTADQRDHLATLISEEGKQDRSRLRHRVAGTRVF
jgi:hypothetical protein